MKNLALTILIGLFPFFLTAQTGAVKGKVTDSTRQSLVNATVSVLYKKDSSLVSYTLSNEKGAFEFKNIAAGDYHLFVSYNGYAVHTKQFSITADKQVLDFGTITLEPEYKTLTGVVVSDASPVKMNGDTISFKANAFNSKPDATVEDVLKKIPGVQVSKDGTIKAMGEQVQKVYVDGKEFFGNDPKLATKNLTADMVDQIQVFDDMSEQSRFTKIDDGSRSKSINIKLKKDRRKGDFGRATAGAGSDSRYEGNFSFNHFRGNRRISLVGSANNTNKLSYTFNDFGGGQGNSQFSNGGGMAGGGMINPAGGAQGGVSRPLSTGINFNDTWGPKVDFRGSYFFSNNSNILEQNKFRRNSFPGDSASEVSTYSNIYNSNRSHRMNIRVEYQIDSLNSLLYSANFGQQDYMGNTVDTSITVSVGANKYIAAKSNSDRHDDRKGFNYSGELLYRRRFDKPGRTLTVGWRNNQGNNKGEGNSKSPVTTFNSNGAVTSFLDINQNIFNKSTSGNNSLSVSYTEPIGKNKLFEVNYAYSNSNNLSDKKTFDYNTSSGKYDELNELQTNYFDYKNNSNKVGFNFRHQLKKINYQLGMGFQVADLENRSKTMGVDTTIRQRFTNLFPTANINYAITRSKSIKIYYRGRTNAPSVAQLQDVPDISNPLMIKTGNPSLKQEFINNVNINYNSFALGSQRFFSASLNVNYTNNKIVNSLDSTGPITLIYKPENLDGSFTSSGMLSLNFPFKKIKGVNINLTNMMYLSRDANLVFKKKNFTTLLQVNQSVGINYGKEKYDISLSTAFVYNSAAYDLEGSSSTRYFNHAYSADFTYRFKHRIFFLTDVDYYISSGRTAGYNQNVFLWNMSVAKKIFQTNPAEIKFTVYDILKQNNGVNRLIGENYFEDIRANVVPRFFLVTISYNLNRLERDRGPKQEAPQMMIFK